LLDDNLDGLVYRLCEFGFLEGVLEHHTDREEHSDGVDDALAGDVGCGAYAGWSVEVWEQGLEKHTVDGLVDTVALALAIRDAAERSAGQQTQAAGNDGSLVGDDVAEQVAGDNDTVQSTGVLDHDHGSAVDELMANLQLRELLLHDLSNDLSPQSAGGEHVGLVQTPDGSWGVLGESEVGGETGDALDLGARVGLSVHGVTRAIVLNTVTEVDTTGQFADDVDVDATADFGLERRALDERVRGEEAGSEVAECAHLLAQLEKTLFGTD
jgi:hypothetical protein